MNERITGTEPTYLDCKRVQLKGAFFERTCPECGHQMKDELVDFIGYPKVNQPSNDILYGYCHKCDHEWEVWVQVDLRVRIVEPPEESP